MRKKGQLKKTINKSKLDIKQISAITDNHKNYIKSISENVITICIGPSGTGKTFISSGVCANLLHNKKIDQIIATRPIVSTGMKIGALPGVVSEKIMPYLRPLEENFRFFLGNAYYGMYFNERKIKYEPLELMRGMTFDDAVMILDEAQNCTFDQIKMFITRIGKNSKLIINGDIKQTDLKHNHDLELVIDRLYNIRGIGICKLDTQDIQRNDIIGHVLSALES